MRKDNPFYACLMDRINLTQDQISGLAWSIYRKGNVDVYIDAFGFYWVEDKCCGRTFEDVAKEIIRQDQEVAS